MEHERHMGVPISDMMPTKAWREMEGLDIVAIGTAILGPIITYLKMGRQTRELKTAVRILERIASPSGREQG